MICRRFYYCSGKGGYRLFKTLGDGKRLLWNVCGCNKIPQTYKILCLQRNLCKVKIKREIQNQPRGPFVVSCT